MRIPTNRMERCARQAIVLLLGTALLAAGALAERRSSPVLVQRVIDGDTIVVASVGRVHMLGIAAMKLGAQPATASPLAREAQQRLAGLIANRWVRLEYESDLVPPTSGQAVYVFLEDGRFVNAWLVQEGLARVSARRRSRFWSALQQAQREAQVSRRGMWGAVH
jgi:micrococcal nuclease